MQSMLNISKTCNSTDNIENVEMQKGNLKFKGIHRYVENALIIYKVK